MNAHSIETSHGLIKFKPAVTDGQSKTLVEGTDLFWADGEYIGFAEGLFINDEILDEDNIPEPYDRNDFLMQKERVEEALSFLI